MKEKIKKIMKFFKQHYKFIMLLVVLSISEYLIIRNFDSIKQFSVNREGIETLFSIITIMLLFSYTEYTRRMLKISKEKLEEDSRPFLSCGLISGKKCYSKEIIEQDKRYLLDTRCIVTNLTKYNIKVLVDIKLKINNKDLILKGGYSGKEPWDISSFGGINGHFDLYKDLDEKSSDIFKTEISKPDKKLNMQLDISYCNVDKDQIKFKNPTQYWHFDFTENLWVSNALGIRA